MSIEQLKANLYIETLREEYNNRDFWFNSFCEKAWENHVEEMERIKNQREEYLAMPDYDLSLAGIFKRYINNFSSTMENDRIRFLEKDFIWALLYSYQVKKFRESASDNEHRQLSPEKIVNEFLPLDLSQLTDDVVADYCREHIFGHGYSSVCFSEITTYLNNNVFKYDNDSLEINTLYVEGGDKLISSPNYAYSAAIYYGIKHLEGKINVLSEWNMDMFEGKMYSTIICDIFQNSDASEDIYNERIKCMMTALTNSGRIVVVDNGNIRKPEMYSIRKEMIDNNMLSMYISGFEIEPDIYILQPKSDTHTSKIIMVGDYKGQNQHSDDMFSYVRRLSTDEIVALNYDFNASNELVQGSDGNGFTMSEIFKYCKTGVETVKIEGEYPIFQKKDIATSLDSFTCSSQNLDECAVKGTFIKIIEPKIIIGIDDTNLSITYLVANEGHPAYIGTDYIVVDINTEILIPEYLYLLSIRGIFKEICNLTYLKDLKYGTYYYDPYSNKEIVITPDVNFVSLGFRIQLPSKNVQKKELTDALFINASASKREKALEALLEQKTWLNEKHIRTIKHRIGNELCPIVTDIQQLNALFKKHNGTLSLDTAYGKNGHVSDIIDRLTKDINVVSESLSDLTKAPEKRITETIELSSFLKDFCCMKENSNLYHLKSDLTDGDFWVVGNKESLSNLLFEIIHNACRHGFEKDTDCNAIIICTNADNNGNVILSVKNNGKPMSELGEKNYFLRGMVAGATGHSGNGGADIKDIADSIGADVSLANDQNSEWPVCVRISLPIINSRRK